MTTPTIKDIRAAAAARRARRVRHRRLLIGAAVVLAGLVVLSVWVVPPVLQGQIERRGSEALARAVTVGKVSFNPMRLAVTLDDLAVADTAGGQWLGWDRLRLNLRAWSLLRGRLGFDEIALDGFVGKVAVDGEGRLNFQDLLDRDANDAAKEDEDEPTVIEIGSLAVRNARIDFSDASQEGPFATTLGPVSFSLEDFRTVGDPQAPYDLVAETEAGERLSWRGRLSTAPLRSQGTLELAGLRVAKYGPYLSRFTAAEIRDGILHARAAYAVEVREAGLDLKLDESEVTLEQLVMAEPGAAENALAAHRVVASGIRLDWSGQDLEVGAVEWTGGRVRLVNRADGIDLVNLLAPPASAGRTADPAPESGLRVRLGRLQVAGLEAAWRDETLGEPAEVAVDQLGLLLEQVDLSALDQPVPLRAEAVLAGDAGRITVAGEVELVPFRPTLEVNLDQVALAPGRAYVREATGWELADGILSLEGSLGSAADSLVFRGDLGATGVKLADQAGQALAAWEDLRVEGLSAVAVPLTVEVDRIRWVRPELAVVIAQDGAINWAGPTAPNAAPAERAVAEEAESGPAPVVRLHRIELVEARLAFRDESLVRPAGAVLEGLSGELTGLSSVEPGKGRADLRGRANGSAAVAIQGDFNPLGRPAYSDLRIDFDRVDLSPLGGYVGHYAGYALQRGRMSLDVDFKLQDRSIDSETVVTLDGFTLGQKVPSPDATTLPVGLALKLLRDIDGRIVVDLPVKGSLDDPEFRVGRVVWRVITNLMAKAATAPFALLGGLVGGGGAADELDQQVFAAASAELSPAAIEKLDTLARALAQRPEVNVAIHGEYAPAADAEAWRPVVLEKRLREGATAGQWSAENGWAEKARPSRLVSLYLEVFGEPPVDPDATLAAVEATAEAKQDQLTATNPPPAGTPQDESLLGWLRRVFGVAQKEPEGATVREPVPGAPRAGAAPPPALRLLPPAEIERRLLEAVEIEEGELAELAMARAAAVQAQLIDAGVAAARLSVAEPAEGEARVRLELR